LTSSLDGKETKWACSIPNFDRDISRLINSFLSSPKGKSSITCNVLKIWYAFMNKENTVEFFEFAEIVQKALVVILIEEKENADVIKICLQILRLANFTDWHLWRDFFNFGICKALLSIMEHYLSDENRITDVLSIIDSITSFDYYVDRFVNAGLIKALVNVYKSSYSYEMLPYLVRKEFHCDPGVYEQFHQLDIPEGSSFFALCDI
jgi:hypothetical protein